ncbi:MAG: carbonic anhydrase [Acidobacteriaceae bacterium]|nr:carbonic anhydrase [Acidobacteriaceae bacterium]
MNRLRAGYARFRTSVFPGVAPALQKLAHGQAPEALLITCSDSRVMPEMILQAEPGQIFPIRLAGNLVPRPGVDPSGIAATVEYAVRALKVADIIVCGHSGCGAMKELMERAHTHDLPDVTSWLEYAGPSARWLRSSLEEAKNLSDAERLQLISEANVLAQLDHLQQHQAVRDGLAAGTLALHGWMFDIPNGELREFNEKTGVFEPMVVELENERLVA